MGDYMQGFCPQCDRKVLAVLPDGPNHLFHLVMTVITGGAWIVIWGLAVFSEIFITKRARCTVCGSKVEERSPYDFVKSPPPPPNRGLFGLRKRDPL